VGVLLPWLALAVWSPFLAYFAFGGPITIWGIPSLAVLGGAALLVAFFHHIWGSRRSGPPHLEYCLYSTSDV
jgi:hypothetical protein